MAANEFIYTAQKYATSPMFEREREHYSSIEYLDPVHYPNNSRYTRLRTFQDPVTKRYIHETWNQTFLSESDQDQYFTVTIAEENRLDIVANMYYYTPKYWWVIALANYIIDPFDVPMNTVLRIPPITVLYDEGGILNG